MFVLIRIIVFLAISSFAVIILLKSTLIHKKLVSLLSIILCLAIVTASAMFPVENLFISFQSPENVFQYTEFGKIENMIYGENSCMVLYTSGSSSSHSILPKTEKGYQIPGYFTSKRISHRLDEKGCFDVYSVSGTKDYYVIASVNQKAEASAFAVLDKHGEEMKCSIFRGNDTDFLYIYIHDLSEECYLSVQGEKILIME